LRKALLVIGTLGALACASCGGSSKSSGSAQPGAASSQPAQGGTPTAASLISTCISDYNAGDFGAISGSDGSSDPSPYCNCVIPSWLAAGDSAQKIADAMNMDATDSGGVAPTGFSQQTACGSKDPTIDPNTGSPYT
jgi:hypothetical protein